MEREHGSQTVEIFGGMYDGAIGIVLGYEEVDGKIHTRVQLPDGTVVTMASALPEAPETPRETGS